MASQAQYDAAFVAAMNVANVAIKQEVPAFFQSEVEANIGKVKNYVSQLSKAAVDAAEGVK